VFAIAGIWGLIIVPPLYFLIDTIGTQYPPPVTHMDFYYGFIAVTLAWQLAFLVIASDPGRYRPLMPVAMVEKFLYVVTMATLFGMGKVQAGQAAVALPDLVLGSLFVIAFVKTKPH
jgi:hypothetical protein